MTFDADAIHAWDERQRTTRREYRLNGLTHAGVYGPCIRRTCGNHTSNLSGVCRDCTKGEK